MKAKNPIHILIRFSDNLYDTGFPGGTIEAHQAVIQEHGAVWFTKMGTPISQNQIDIANKQIEEGIPTNLYLVKGNRRKSTAYQGTLLLASKTLQNGEKTLVPPYYYNQNIIQYAKFWAKLGDIAPVDEIEFHKLKVASSVLPLGETLFKSSSGHFFVNQSNL